jgi:hypothetical protein
VFELGIRKSTLRGRGVFLESGTLNPRDEVAAFTGQPVNSSSNKRFYKQNGASYKPVANSRFKMNQAGAVAFVEDTQVGITPQVVVLWVG